MEKLKRVVQDCLPEVERFLTSVLLEETNIAIAASEGIDKELFKDESLKDDIFLYGKDKKLKADFIIVLDKEWFGLLSSIMLGVEEKSNNEITRDLLNKFYGDLYNALMPKLVEAGIETSAERVEVFTKTQLINRLSHTEYFQIKLEVDGLADHKVRAEIVIGNPDKPSVTKKTDTKKEQRHTSKENKDEIEEGAKTTFQDTAAATENPQNNTSNTVNKGKIISAKSVQFEEFLEQPLSSANGNTRSMDLLYDVEMDVSVELGRIELPLGKLLQLSKGSVIELEKLAGEPVDILVNGHIIAKGEVVVIDEHFGVKISSLITTRQRLTELS